MQTAGTLAELPALAARRGAGPAVIVIGEIGRALALAAGAAPALKATGT